MVCLYIWKTLSENKPLPDKLVSFPFFHPLVCANCAKRSNFALSGFLWEFLFKQLDPADRCRGRQTKYVELDFATGKFWVWSVSSQLSCLIYCWLIVGAADPKLGSFNLVLDIWFHLHTKLLYRSVWFLRLGFQIWFFLFELVSMIREPNYSPFGF